MTISSDPCNETTVPLQQSTKQIPPVALITTELDTSGGSDSLAVETVVAEKLTAIGRRQEDAAERLQNNWVLASL